MSSIRPTSPDVGQCAEAICDQHLPAQLQTVANTLAYALCSHGVASRYYGDPDEADETVGKWAAEDWENFLWLSFYGMALAEESDIRFGELNPSVADIICSGQTGLLMSDCNGDNLTSPEYWFRPREVNKNMDVFDAHRKNVLRGYAQMAQDGTPPTWTGVNPPLWVLKHAR